VLEELQNAVRRGVKIRLLSAEDDFITELLNKLRASGIIVRRIETPTEAKFKMLITDKRSVFLVETKDDSRAQFREAVGNGIFSNSSASVLPYVTIFESFWRETDLYEKAREADRVKDEFVHIAAHELRNPVMPILTGAELMSDMLPTIKDKLGSQAFDELDGIVKLLSRNATRLLRLSEDILQVSRIEIGNFALNYAAHSLNNILESSIEDVKRRYTGERPDVKIILDRRYGHQDIKLYCDQNKITQALMNLIDNAMKFTTEGEVIIVVKVSDIELFISVQDSGTGVDPEVKPRLFEKFVTKSTNGTGLGLYLCRRIIEAHGGRIWYDETHQDRGATFSFVLPIDERSVFSNASKIAPEVRQ
jgi:signal transduction histidine kinase